MQESHKRLIAEAQANNAQPWEIRKLTDEQGETPPPEMVQEFAQSIQNDMIARRPAADLSLPI